MRQLKTQTKKLMTMYMKYNICKVVDQLDDLGSFALCVCGDCYHMCWKMLRMLLDDWMDDWGMSFEDDGNSGLWRWMGDSHNLVLCSGRVGILRFEWGG